MKILLIFPRIDENGQILKHNLFIYLKTLPPYSGDRC
jgi:hypothetical protein